MDMWMHVQNTSKSLRHGDDTGAGVRVKNRVGHQLFDGLIGEPCQVGEKLSA